MYNVILLSAIALATVSETAKALIIIKTRNSDK